MYKLIYFLYIYFISCCWCWSYRIRGRWNKTTERLWLKSDIWSLCRYEKQWWFVFFFILVYVH